MPFRHVAMYRWAAHVDGVHVDRVRAAFDELAAAVPGLHRHEHGHDVGVSEGTFDFLVVADFGSVADWHAYRDHPAHVLLVAELIDGHVVDQASGQYQATDVRETHEVSSARMHALLAEPDAVATPRRPGDADDEHGDESDDESDNELLARARRAAMAEMQALLAEPDEPTS